jgi:hypothetical protein
MVWACFDRTDFAILGIVFVLYSVPVYFNPASGPKNLPGFQCLKSPTYTPIVTRLHLSIMNSWSTSMVWCTSAYEMQSVKILRLVLRNV